MWPHELTSTTCSLSSKSNKNNINAFQFGHTSGLKMTTGQPILLVHNAVIQTKI
jgi:hypothetical protein